jgi:ribosomal-protein-alanine N-acetyltransferase
MSALPRESAAPLERGAVMPMDLADLDEVLAIENAAYPFPWTRGNFIDSLAAGYLALRLPDRSGRHTLGYFLAMPGVQEMHLLNLTVAPAEQGRGHARHLLGVLQDIARQHEAQALWLEVRPSNERALALYQRYGFVRVGLRRGYYPAALGRREDAIVMRLALDDAAGTPPDAQHTLRAKPARGRA